MATKSLKILLVEDDELFRLGLSVRLQRETDLEIVAEAGDGETAVELANRYPLDMILLDLSLPRMSGLEACQQIHSRYPHLPILILTSREDKSLIPRSINAGAKGYCLKGIPAENLMMAIRSVAAGASWWDATATEVICATVLGDSPPASSPSLTNREREILQLLQQGKSNQEIAQQLYISPGTVRVHVHAILQKAGTSDRHRALLWAQEHHLI